MPARNRVAPNSPSARANESTAPAAMLLHESGSIKRTKIFALLHPNVRAASSIFASRLSNAPKAFRYMSGNATTTAAITHAVGLKIRGKPISIQNWPNAVQKQKAAYRRRQHHGNRENHVADVFRTRRDIEAEIGCEQA